MTSAWFCSIGENVTGSTNPWPKFCIQRCPKPNRLFSFRPRRKFKFIVCRLRTSVICLAGKERPCKRRPKTTQMKQTNLKTRSAKCNKDAPCVRSRLEFGIESDLWSFPLFGTSLPTDWSLAACWFWFRTVPMWAQVSVPHFVLPVAGRGSRQIVELYWNGTEV